jgi:hypothetical protein
MSEYSGSLPILRWNGDTEIGQVRDINGPALQQANVDVTVRGDADQVYLGGLRDGGEVTFDLIYDPNLATQTILRTALEAGTINMLEFALLRTSTVNPPGFRFFALVTAFTPKAPLADALAADVTFQLTKTVSGLLYLVDETGEYLVDETTQYLIM